MKYFFNITIGLLLLITAFGIVKPVHAGSCSDSGSSCHEGPNGCVGKCVPCSKTEYYLCGVAPYQTQCSCQVQSSCCDNGYCTVCTSDGQCYTNGCPAGGGGPGGGGSGPNCGDGVCNNGETCSTCSTDCGACLTTNVNVRGVVVPSTTADCNAVNNGSQFINTTFKINDSTAATSNGATYAQWTGLAVGTQAISSYTPSSTGYVVLPLACYTLTPPGTTGNAFAVTTAGDDTVTWNVAFANGVPWIQAQGGDVYAATNIKSYIAAGSSPRYFDLNGLGGTAGVVTYGTDYNFDNSSSYAKGEAYVSQNPNATLNGWLANDTNAATDYYQVMYHRFGSPTVADFPGGTTITDQKTQIPGREKPYYISGDLTIDSTDWNIANGESVVVLVNGNLTIRRKINIIPGGFLAFIVNGNITVDPSVGVAATSSTPVLEGIYITSLNKIFYTGNSSIAGAERFVGKGTFVAGDFDFQRDLPVAANDDTNTSAQLFIYNPQLLLTMPDTMRDLPISWQEVAP